MFLPNSSEVLGAQPSTQFYSFWLGVYLDVIHTWQEANDSSLWYLRSGNFTVEYPGFLKTKGTSPPQASGTTTSGSYPIGTVTGAITETSGAKSTGATTSTGAITETSVAKSTGATTSATLTIGFGGTLLALSAVGLAAEVFLGC